MRPFNLLAKDVDVQDAFYTLCNSNETDINLSNAIEKFVCTMYGKKKFDHVDDVRYQIFLDKYKPLKNLSNVKKLDGSMMPPCFKVLVKKMKRTRLIARRLSYSPRPHMCNYSPPEERWNLEDGKYVIDSFDGEDTSIIRCCLCRKPKH